VSERYPLVNAAASPRRYESEPRGMFDACRAMHRQGTDVLAVYHSHPTTEPVPSRSDREQNYSTGVVNLIISLQDGDARARAWWLTDEGQREAEWECV